MKQAQVSEGAIVERLTNYIGLLRRYYSLLLATVMAALILSPHNLTRFLKRVFGLRHYFWTQQRSRRRTHRPDVGIAG